MERTGLSERTIYRLIKADEFLKPIRLGVRAARWEAHRIDEWIEARAVATGYAHTAGLRHHHPGEDVFALHDVKVESVVRPNGLPPLLLFRVAHLGGRHEKECLQVGEILLGVL